MNAVLALNLRKTNNGTLGSHWSEKRFIKNKNSISDILVRNFFRKYPIEGDSKNQQKQIKHDVTFELETFVKQNPQINSKNLQEFETKLS